MQYKFRLYALILKILKFIILKVKITKEGLGVALDKRHYVASNKKVRVKLNYIRKVGTC